MDDKVMTEELEKRVREAVDYFMAGYGCGQSVVAAFADLYGVDEETALKIGAGFGGGVGRMRMMCGAVSGLVILAGLETGQTSGGEFSHARTGSKSDATSIRTDKAECYRLVQSLLEKFRLANGSIICADLLGLTRNPAEPLGHTAGELSKEQQNLRPESDVFTPSERNAEYYRVRPCAAKVESAARIFAGYLQSKSQT